MLNQLHYRKQQGWALIETMLAVSIMAVAFTSTMYFLNRVEHQKFAQRTAQEIKMILGASISYYHDHHENWPANVNPDLTGADGYLLPSKDASNEKPAVHGDDKNPWLLDYIIHLTGQASTPNTDLEVGTCIPGLDLARSLAAILPHGTVDQPGTTWLTCPNVNYHSVITRIATISGKKTFHFDVGIYKAGDSIPKPTCTHGTQPTIFLIPVAIDTGGHPISAMTAYAVDDNSPTSPSGDWVAHVQVITDEGLKRDRMNSIPGSATQYASVVAIRDCVSP